MDPFTLHNFGRVLFIPLGRILIRIRMQNAPTSRDADSSILHPTP